MASRRAFFNDLTDVPKGWCPGLDSKAAQHLRVRVTLHA